MLKLHASVSKKVGLPGFSSTSASCTIETELDGSLLHDHAGFQIVVKRAYQSCEKAVEDQIARLTSDGPDESSQPLTRASHVEPDAEGYWWADMGPVDGPVLGPFKNRTEALGAERGWLVGSRA